MTAFVDINKKALTEFEEFMTAGLIRETERAYSRTLVRLAKGATDHIRVRMTHSDKKDGWKNWIAAGVDYSPKAAKKVEARSPMVIAVGIRKTHLARARGAFQGRSDDSGLSSPFPVTLRTVAPGLAAIKKRPVSAGEWKKSKYAGRRVMVARVGKKSYPIRVLFTLKKQKKNDNAQPSWAFNHMVREYVAKNHDKVFSQQFKQAVKRAAR